MTETPIPPKQSGTQSSNDDLAPSRPSGKTVLKILLVLAALLAAPVIILIAVWSTVR